MLIIKTSPLSHHERGFFYLINTPTFSPKLPNPHPFYLFINNSSIHTTLQIPTTQKTQNIDNQYILITPCLKSNRTMNELITKDKRTINEG
ncbi:hypothetical protein C4H12_03025 [Capnocytophaga sp. oral taxon 878]|nr:hypothetical protein C4H12_03025 [Capnocytophaga sp. oral taxon 878]